MSGNAIVEHLIRQPKNEWYATREDWFLRSPVDTISRGKIVITSRTPLKYTWQDARVSWIGIDFLESPEKIVPKIKALCHDVTHAFFTSYVHNDDLSKLRGLNEPLFKNFLLSIDEVAGKNFQRLVLQTGGKVGACEILVKSDLTSAALRCTSWTWSYAT